MRDILSKACLDIANLHLDTDVVIIGNGPAGISLSTFLSGWQPFYNLDKPHPDAIIHEHLAKHAKESLLEQDLLWFEEECAARLSPTSGAFAGLYDSLVRPPKNDESGSLAQSCLKWKRRAYCAIPHIVLGDSDIGGSWNTYDGEMITVSISSWMDLPGFSIEEWMGGSNSISRLPAAVIREYLKAYAKRMQIDSHFRSFTKVTNVAKFCFDWSPDVFWEVRGVDRKGHNFTLKCKNVVLACGQSNARTLEVSGEINEPNVAYDIASMKRLLAKTTLGCHDENLPVLVIGDGITAADAVLSCVNSSIPVLQVVRRDDKQLRNVMLSRLSATIYPEYAKVYRLMTRKGLIHSKYRCLTSTQVVSFDNNNNVPTITLNTPEGILQERFRCVVVCIGRRSDLSILEDKTEFLANYQSSTEESLFAIGSLAGDHYVRFLIGGAMQVAQKILDSYKVFDKEEQSSIMKSMLIPPRVSLPLVGFWKQFQ